MQPDNRDKSGKFKKGQTGNPGGRPAMPEEFKELAKKHSLSALQVAIDIMLQSDNKPSDRLKAVEIVIDRAYGKPAQATELTGPNGGPLQTVAVDLSGLTLEELRKLAKLE